MKTGIEYVYDQFERMADLTREYLSHPHELNLFLALNTINYLEGLAFSAMMAHKETEKDSDIAAAMCGDAKFVREWYYEIKLGK